jgi:hypothetical protein
MSQDGSPQQISKKLKNDRPNTRETLCGCTPTSTYYMANGSSFVRCSDGATHCTRCLRPAYKFRKGWTCGPGCAPYSPPRYAPLVLAPGYSADEVTGQGPWIPAQADLDEVDFDEALKANYQRHADEF